MIQFSAVFTVQPFTYNKCFLSKKLFISDKKDMKIVIGDQQIMVHKIILETFSTIFKKMIEAQSSDNENVIEITDCDYQIFENVIKFCYGISEILPTKIEDLIFMLEFSSKYEINDLKKEIEFKLMPQISEKNISKLTNAAIKNNAEMLKAVCQSKLSHFANVGKFVNGIESLDSEFVKEVFQDFFADKGRIESTAKILSKLVFYAFVAFMFSLLYIVIFFADKQRCENCPCENR